MQTLQRSGSRPFLKRRTVVATRPWRAAGVWICRLIVLSGLAVPIQGYAALCMPDSSAGETRTVAHILPSDSVVEPWRNETPSTLRSGAVVDGRQAMRVDLVNWAPVAFDDYGASQVPENAILQLWIRSGIDRPPLAVSLGGAEICPLEQFAVLSADQWTRVSIPLQALGRTGSGTVGRLRIKSQTSSAFVVWVADVQLAVPSESSGLPDDSDGLVEPDASTPPDGDASDEATDNQLPPMLDASELALLADWRSDPGVQERIDSHVPSNSVTVQANGNDELDDSAAFAAALASSRDGGVIRVPAGTFYLSSSLSLGSAQVLRGAGRGLTRLIFTRSLPFGVGIQGQYPQAPVAVRMGRQGSRRLVVSRSPAFAAGRFAVLDEPGTPNTQTVRITGVVHSGTTTVLSLAFPLHTTFSTASVARPFTAVEHAGIERLSLDVASRSVRVADMILMRSAANVWVRNVTSRRAFAAHVFTRQTTQCEIRNSTFIDATGHHDGKQGYGIDLANSTSRCLVEDNLLSRLRHSILLQGGASGNVIAYNHSRAPRHTNFANGGPGDISIHGHAAVNLVEANVVERIHIGDASLVEGSNVYLRNCLTRGPLTIGNVSARQWLLGNAMFGSDARLRATSMPPVPPFAPTARPYLGPGQSLFNEDGLAVTQASAAPPASLGNWHAGQRWTEGEGVDDVRDIPDSYYRSDRAPILQGAITGDWRADCAIPATMRGD